MAQFQSYNKILVCQEDGISNIVVNGQVVAYVLKCRYPSYRGTYLSCIEALELYVDGARVEDERISLHLNGKIFPISQLKELFSEYWFILDKGTLRIWQPGGLAEGEHTVEIRMRHRIPYTGYFGEYLVLDSRDEKQLEVLRGVELDG